MLCSKGDGGFFFVLYQGTKFRAERGYGGARVDLKVPKLCYVIFDQPLNGHGQVHLNNENIANFRSANLTPSSSIRPASGAWKCTRRQGMTKNHFCPPAPSSPAALTTPSGSGTWITTWQQTHSTRETSTQTSSSKPSTWTLTSTTLRRRTRPTLKVALKKRMTREMGFDVFEYLTMGNSWHPATEPETSGFTSCSSWTSCARSRLTMPKFFVLSTVVEQFLSAIQRKRTQPKQVEQSSKSTKTSWIVK